MNAITTSVFELFKCGPGPSSSHTIGPMRAGNDFLQVASELPQDILDQAATVEIRLYGSLSATGRGHGTHKAVVAGLLGQTSEGCPSGFMDEMFQTDDARYAIRLHNATAWLGIENIVFDGFHPDSPYSNTLEIKLLGAGPAPAVLFEREYYSVGGGFIQWKGGQTIAQGEPVYPYATMAELKAILNENGIQLHKLILENEKAITGESEDAIFDKLAFILATMDAAVTRGLQSKGALPGLLLQRKASYLFQQYLKHSGQIDAFLRALSAYAFAVSEENAAGHLVVTAPTCGSAGVIPAVLYAMKHHFKVPERTQLEGLLACCAVGFLAKHNASLAGAEVGCQGEIGVASAMAAALLTYANGFDFQSMECAAESALEHHLGLTCDPVGGFVQIPCIERNAMGAVKAHTAYLIATSMKPGLHVIGLDQAIRAMAETGRDMNSKYKETSLGGLAVSLVDC